MTNRIPDQLADVQVLDFQGKRVRMDDLWRQQTIVLTLVRHFG